MAKKLVERPPFEIKKCAQVDDVFDHYCDKLEWSNIRIIPENPFSMDAYIANPEPVDIKSVKRPPVNAHKIHAYAYDMIEYLDLKLQQFLSLRTITSKDKRKVLEKMYRRSRALETKYDSSDLVNLASGITWLILDTSGNFRNIPTNPLRFGKLYNVLADEFRMRRSLFSSFSGKIRNAIADLEFASDAPMIEWTNKRGSAIKVVEYFYALEIAQEFSYIGDAKEAFQRQVEKLFGLGEQNWADLEYQIRKRRKEKYQFLAKLCGKDKD